MAQTLSRRRRSFWWYLVPFLLFLVLAGFFLKGLYLDPRMVPSVLVGKPAPTFVLPRLDTPDKTFDLQQMRGKVWMLNVWSSWCDTCPEEFPIMNQIRRAGTLPIIGVDYKDTRAQGITALQRLGNPFEVCVQGGGKEMLDWGVYGVPETFLVDAKGIIRYKVIGTLDSRQWQQKVLPLVLQLQKEAGK